MPGLEPHIAEDIQFPWSLFPQDSQDPFMNMTINALQTGWTLMDCVSSVCVWSFFPPSSYNLRTSLFDIPSPARCIFSAPLSPVRVCPKAAFPPPTPSP